LRLRREVLGPVRFDDRVLPYTGRANVCRFGEHVDARVQKYTLVPNVKLAAREGMVRLDNLQVNVCPDHFEQLRTDGFLGFVLPGDDR